MNVERSDVVVVGGGPAGLTAALTLARAGAAVTVVDENATLGGQYFKRRTGAVRARYGDYRPAGSALIAAVLKAGIRCFNETVAWGAQGDLLLTSRLVDGKISSLQGRALLLATGAYERSVPFPGWTLPGVYTPGCALQMAHIDRVRVGRRVIVAGTGPFLLPAACALLDAGASVRCILELNTPYRPSMTALAALAHPARIAELARYRAYLQLHRVPIRQGWRVLAAHGEGRVEQVTIGRVGRHAAQTEQIEADALCVGYGFRPSTELARLLGCAMVVDPASGDLAPTTDMLGRTSRSGLYAAGEAMGIAGVHAAWVRGLLAAEAIGRDLGLQALPARQLRAAHREARQIAAFTRITHQLYPLPSWLYTAIPDDTTVCRCEEVTAREIRQATVTAWRDIQAVKAITRAGMGICQGRQCSSTVAALMGETIGIAGSFWPRMPVKPIGYPDMNLSAEDAVR